jgi:hypothetical protein
MFGLLQHLALLVVLLVAVVLTSSSDRLCAVLDQDDPVIVGLTFLANSHNPTEDSAP